MKENGRSRRPVEQRVQEAIGNGQFMEDIFSRQVEVIVNGSGTKVTYNF